ncbi:MAG: hypothetical protein Q8J97_09225, partial [Flavobacteriaceae bacterium]|nr:hypothetical protein [Flavobacteriaceae bacterium]
VFELHARNACDDLVTGDFLTGDNLFEDCIFNNSVASLRWIGYSTFTLRNITWIGGSLKLINASDALFEVQSCHWTSMSHALLFEPTGTVTASNVTVQIDNTTIDVIGGSAVAFVGGFTVVTNVALVVINSNVSARGTVPNIASVAMLLSPGSIAAVSNFTLIAEGSNIRAEGLAHIAAMSIMQRREGPLNSLRANGIRIFVNSASQVTSTATQWAASCSIASFGDVAATNVQFLISDASIDARASLQSAAVAASILAETGTLTVLMMNSTVEKSTVSAFCAVHYAAAIALVNYNSGSASLSQISMHVKSSLVRSTAGQSIGVAVGALSDAPIQALDVHIV